MTIHTSTYWPLGCSNEIVMIRTFEFVMILKLLKKDKEFWYISQLFDIHLKQKDIKNTSK